jgi:WD40-like Beta Propeller Repeat
MAEDAPHISLDRVLVDEVPIAPHESVAIVREICERAASGTPDGIAPMTPGKVWLESAGSVQVSRDAALTVRSVADLLEVLLFATRLAASQKLPGPLVLTVARGLGTVDAPEFRSCADFSRALARFDAPDRKQALRTLFARWSGHRPGVATAAPDLFATLTPPIRARRPLPRLLMVATAATGLAAGILIGVTTVAKDSRDVTPSTPGANGVSPQPSSSASPASPSPPATSEPDAPRDSQPVPTTGSSEKVERVLAPLIDPGTADADGVYSPSFASNGSAVFFHTDGPNGSALKRADRSDAGAVLHVATILDDGAKNYHVQLSPDGETVAFDSDRDGERAVYLARPDGSGVLRVSGDGYAAMPRWSPDGRRLSLLRGEPDRPKVWNLWLLDVASGALTRVTEHTYGQVWGGSWFADGQRIAYSHEDRLIVQDLQTTRRLVYESPKRGQLLRTPAVSPDGRYVIFQVFRDGGWLLDLTNGSMERVLNDSSAEEFAWSPDGRRVAFQSRRTGEWGLWVMGR